MLPNFSLFSKISKYTWQILTTTLLLILVDALLLTLLPILKLSYGPVAFSLSAIACIRISIVAIMLFFIHRFRIPKAITLITVLIQLGILFCEFYGLYVEPFALDVSKIDIDLKLETTKPITILQLSDLHMERITKRETNLKQLIKTSKPDIIVLTGDYINLSFIKDPVAYQDARNFIKSLSAPYGVYAIDGTLDDRHSMLQIFSGLPNIIVLDDSIATITVNDQELSLIGVENIGFFRDKEMLKALTKDLNPNIPSILLYHNPDLVEEAADLGISAYFAGHTHGGQIRIPGYGAIITFSRFYKKYEAGSYKVKNTFLYVTRGIGMEGSILPRVRFLCKPEVVVYTVR